MTSSDEIADWLVSNHQTIRDRTEWIREAYTTFKRSLDPDLLYYARHQALQLIREEITIELAKCLPADPLDVIVLLDTPALAYFLE
jgi:hypothetical protein